jgi:hypothetical protein
MKLLDNYILDVPAVVLIIQHIFESPTPPHEWTTWARNHLEEACNFFMRPYCKEAVRMLGYVHFPTDDRKGGKYEPGFFLSSKECNSITTKNDLLQSLICQD